MISKVRWNAPHRPKNEQEFHTMMLGLDQYLISQEVKPHARSLTATYEIAKAYKFIAPFMAPTWFADKNPAPFSDQDLINRCRTWYDSYLGDRQNDSWPQDSYVYLLRGEYWKINIPKIWGQITFFIDKKIEEKSSNILNLFDGLQQSYADTLTEPELIAIANQFIIGYKAVTALQNIHSIYENNPVLIEQAYTDYLSSIRNLLSHHESYGKCRRDTALCCEKIMKGILSNKDISFAKEHKLVDLAKEINDHLGTSIDLDLIRKIHTSANVSYEQHVSRSDAYNAHMNLLTFLVYIGDNLALLQ